MPHLDRMCILKQAVSKYNQTILALETPITWLRPRQIDALYSLRESKDLVVVLPTGYGKTLIFELIPFYLQCKVVVLQPLNVILNQLCSRLDGHVISVTEHFQDLSKLLWAHCILHWQDEFRPAYKEIKNLQALFPVYTICAMTATINKDSIKSIKKELKLSRCSIINCTPLLRKNISLLVKRRPPYSSDTTPTSPYDCIFKSLFEELIQRKENGSCFPVTIVYTRLVWCGKAVEQAKLLLGDKLYNGEKKEENCIVVQYHSPQYSKVNEHILHCLSTENNHIKIIFATIALGMGADLRKVHRVIHAGCPSSVEGILIHTIKSVFVICILGLKIYII
ncbi:hypothetical protein ACJMK2_028860 [Sinanodonta woodiana]|uniref:DNA 3'-5' helicase n=1 Tax=Sinanodonta woodiana TaxID=1069815 RepID=A0ABD3X8E7_SINWO